MAGHACCGVGVAGEVAIGLWRSACHAHGVHEGQQVLHALRLLQLERRRRLGRCLLLSLHTQTP